MTLKVALALDSVWDTVLQWHRCDSGGSHTVNSIEVWTSGMGCHRLGQFGSVSALWPENQPESVCSGKLRAEKVQLFHTERDAENYSGSLAPQSM